MYSSLKYQGYSKNLSKNLCCWHMITFIKIPTIYALEEKKNWVDSLLKSRWVPDEKTPRHLFKYGNLEKKDFHYSDVTLTPPKNIGLWILNHL